jgi:hypothetical protein
VFSRNPYDRLFGEKPIDKPSWYDTMQVCANGHVINDSTQAFPQHNSMFCQQCGATTTTTCNKCGKPIPGQYHVPGFVGGPPIETPPKRCGECGGEFPWTILMNQQGANEVLTSVVFPPDDKRTPSTNKVFIVHGHDDLMKQVVARILSRLELEPIILHEQANEGKTIIEKFEKYAEAGFAVVLLSGDDMAYPSSVDRKKAKPRPRARQNVIMELGFFMGSLGRGNVFPLYKPSPDFELPSDYQGIIYTIYDEAGAWQNKLVLELKTAKYHVDANKLL